ITRAPEHGVWKGGIDVTGGSYGRMDVTANVIGGIGDAAYSVDGGRRTIELVPGHAGETGTFATRWDGNSRVRSEERRVGKECRCRVSAHHYKKKRRK